MEELLSTEIKDDLENIYKITGDLLNLLEVQGVKCQDKDTRELFELIRFRLTDIGGTLQKDIYNCGYLETKFKALSPSEKT